MPFVRYAHGVRLTSTILLLLGLVACDGALTPVGPGRVDEPRGPAAVIAVAGPDLVVLEGSRVSVVGSASRALVGEPALAWSQREGPAVVLSNPSSASPVFVAPLSPARLVFVLEATTDNRRDVDTIVVDVVDHASLLPATPVIFTLTGDRSHESGAEFVVDEPWTGRGDPAVDIRCEAAVVAAPAVVAGRLRLTIVPATLPCPIVIDDVVADGSPGAGRAALTLWPAEVAVAPATRASVTAAVGDTDGPSFLEPGEAVAVVVDTGTRVFFADGRVIPLAVSTASPSQVTFVAPTSPTRLTLFAEGREGSSSGGLRVIAFEVRAGSGNAAPVVDAGADLRVRPGARFRIVPTVSDDDGDDVVVSVTQVLGETAQQLGGGVGTLLAPASAQTLLFHVVGNDGVVDSAADPVRVVVDAAAENQPPILTVPAELYVVPGGTFVVDASSARDPDDGLIASTRIAQLASDPVQLLEAPVDAARVTLTAGQAGDVYRFVLSATDDGGLETSAPLTVIVQDAGPWVDPVRGLADGNGTVERPFANIAAALDTAARHRFESLLLAGGPLVLEALPAGLGLVGGHVFVDGAYVDSGERSRLTITGAVDVAGATLQRLTIGGVGSLRLRRHVVLRELGLTVPLTVLASANVEVVASAVVDVTVDRAIVAFDDVAFTGQLRGQGATIAGHGGSIVVARGPAIQLIGGALTTTSMAVQTTDLGVQLSAGAIASLGGRLDVTATDGEGTASVVTVGVRVEGASVDFAGFVVHVHGGGSAAGVVAGAGAVVGGVVDLTVDDVGTAIGIDGSAAPLGGRLSGEVVAIATASATGIAALDGVFVRLRVTADAAAAVGIVGPRVDARAVLVIARGANAVGVAVDAGTLKHVTVVAEGTAVVGTAQLAVRNAALRAPVGVSGDVDLGVVGLAADEPAGCPGCIIAPALAVDADSGVLASDDVLGAANPFVDVGALADAVAVDLDGRDAPRGRGPDLGAIERN